MVWISGFEKLANDLLDIDCDTKKVIKMEIPQSIRGKLIEFSHVGLQKVKFFWRLYFNENKEDVFVLSDENLSNSDVWTNCVKFILTDAGILFLESDDYRIGF